MLLEETEGTEGGIQRGPPMDKGMREMRRGPQPGAVQERWSMRLLLPGPVGLPPTRAQCRGALECMQARKGREGAGGGGRDLFI